MTPFIVMLATMEIYKGIVYVITKGMPLTGMSEAAENLANGVLVGIPTERIEMMAYKLTSFQASIGESWQMDSITAAVLGGTSMAGGVGSVVGTIIGDLLSSAISTCITLLRISSYREAISLGRFPEGVPGSGI